MVNCQYKSTFILQTIIPWRSIACNSAGTKLIAAIESNHVYTSNDSAINWTQQNIVGVTTADWRSVTMDASGDILLACGNFSGTINLSLNGGITWNQVTTQTGWRCVAVSKNAQHMIAVRTSNALVSHDGGTSWSNISIASSTLLTCCIDNNGNAYVGGNGSTSRRLTYNSSTGVTTLGTILSITNVYAMACSADGQKVVIVNQLADANASVLISTDGGGSFTDYQSQINTQCGTIVGWKTCAISGDGTKIVLGQGNNIGNIIILTI